MQRAMVFIDYENFNIALSAYYKTFNELTPRLDFNKIPNEVVKMLPHESLLVKTFLFAPKPDDFLMQDSRRSSIYNWINGLKNQKYFTVIEGQHLARPVSGFTFRTMDINNPSSYYVVEKGTDINMATHIITKAFLNSYDTAVILSGDSDYIPVIDVLNTMGKTAVSVGVQGQNLARLKGHADDTIILQKIFFNKCLRPPKQDSNYEDEAGSN